MPPGNPVPVKGSGLQKKYRQTLDGLLFCAYNISEFDASLNDAGRVGSFMNLLPLPVDRAELRRRSIKADSSTVSFTPEQEVSAEASVSRSETVNGTPTLVVNGGADAVLCLFPAGQQFPYPGLRAVDEEIRDPAPCGAAGLSGQAGLRLYSICRRISRLPVWRRHAAYSLFLRTFQLHDPQKRIFHLQTMQK